MRWVACSLFVAAAFDVALPWLDRPGTAALALAFGILAVGAAFPAPRRARVPDVPPRTVALGEEPAAGLAARSGSSAGGGRPDELGDLLERIAAYTGAR